MEGRPFVAPAFGALGLAAFFIGLALLFFHGQLESSDEITMARTAMELTERGSLRFSEPVFGREYSEYGIGTSLAAIPAYLLDRTLASFGWLEGYQLLTLTNAVILALLAIALAGFLKGDRRWGAIALPLAASPLLPVSLTLYSELLTSLGLISLALGLWRGDARWGPSLAFAGALAALLARLASLPLAAIILFWGWRSGASYRSLSAGGAGIAAAGMVSGFVNLALRGGFFATGYEGQEFTTPLLAGLYGVIFSPERGVLIFFPALLAPYLFWRHLPGRMRSFSLLAGGLLLFAAVFHARFWTWHGGWTVGPRFLLPVLPFFVPPIACLLIDFGKLSRWERAILLMALAWSGLLAYIYSQHSVIMWWNQLWGFHQRVSNWLFNPQLSLWFAWFQGVPLPDARGALGEARLAFLTLGLASVIASFYPLLIGWRGYLGTDPEAKDEWKRLSRVNIPAVAYFAAAGLILLFSVVPQLSGPRGWEVLDSPEPMEPPSYLILEGQTGRFAGFVDYPLNGALTLKVKANALYQVRVNTELVMERMEAIPQHLNEAVIDLTPGLHLIEVEVFAKDDDPRFHLYWNWGGEGRYLEAAGGEHMLPRELNSLEAMFTRIWRRKFIALAGLLAFLLLFLSIQPVKTGGEALESKETGNGQP